MPTKLKDEIQPMFDFMFEAGNLIGKIGFFEALQFNPLSDDPEEQIFEFNMKKKKKRKTNKN
ncbi:hypothetical protein [Chryseobacterium oncorhynchi]|uniref:hypothetical protein n=1 Tax=Chryseobacterium oncorhynchi TaxID=741074 RepID=UPI000F4FC7D3|nr:hypothetical protein [Chryseobacterium oncorhynchi]